MVPWVLSDKATGNGMRKWSAWTSRISIGAVPRAQGARDRTIRGRRGPVKRRRGAAARGTVPLPARLARRLRARPRPDPDAILSTGANAR
jgi:hypothetical protein